MDTAADEQLSGVLSEKLRQPYQNLTENPPVELFHYTTGTGLVEIIRSESLWASHCRFLNDPAEFRYGCTLCLNELKEVTEEHSFEPITNEAALRAIGLIENETFLNNVSPHIVCFCEKGDLLSQWRSYGEHTMGYSLGLAAGALEDWSGQEVRLRKIIYRPDDQVSTVRKVIWELLRLMNNHSMLAKQKPEKWESEFALHLVKGILELGSILKPEAFEEEREWRLIVTPNELIKHRLGHGRIIPYVELPLAAEPKSRPIRFPLESIICGPTTNASLAKAGVESLLSNHGYNAASVRLSAIEYRH